MLLLITGLLIFLGIHTLTTLRRVRTRLIEHIGTALYKGLYSAIAALGLVLIIIGFGRYRSEGYIQIWNPPQGLSHLTLLLMWPAMICLVAAYSPGRIAHRLKHPMLVAVKLWALAHLLANGDLGSILLFGSLLAWSVYDRIAVKRRPLDGHEVGDPLLHKTTSWVGDAVAVGGGTVLYLVFAFILHPVLIGVPVVPVSVSCLPMLLSVV